MDSRADVAPIEGARGRKAMMRSPWDGTGEVRDWLGSLDALGLSQERRHDLIGHVGSVRGS